MFKFFKFLSHKPNCLILLNHYHTLPTHVRYSNIVRGPYNLINSKDIDYFKSFLISGQIVTDEAIIESYNIDWLKECKGSSKLVLRPKSTYEVSKILDYCNSRKLAVVPQGGNTGLVHGSIPVFDEIIISMSQMNKILNVNPLSGVLICEAGCILKHLDDHLSQHGLIMPIDLGAKDSCQIGGNLATNAGGLRLLKYGSLRGTVLGLEAVLPSGQIIDCMNTMRKDNTGYDLKQLFIGSEGTLGIITKVCIHCPPRPKDTNVAFFGCDTFEEVIEAYKHAKELLGETLSAFEFMDKECMEAVVNTFGYKYPFSSTPNQSNLVTSSHNSISPYHFLVETIKTSDERFYECASIINCPRTVVARNESESSDIWKLRENIYPALCQYKNPDLFISYDVSLPLKSWPELVQRLYQVSQDTSVQDLADKFSNFYCLIENSGCSELYNKEILEKFCHHLHNILKPAISNDKTMKIVIAQNLGQARMLWKLRESITLSLVSDGYVYKYDISLPLTDFYKLIKDIRAKLLPLGNKIIRVVGYGHVGDGNLHLNVTSKKFYREVLNEIQPYIYQKVTESLQHENKIKRSNCSFEYNLNSTRGSISAEHGLGLVKKEFSYLGKSAVYWRCAQKLKNLFDPIFILNPYKMLNTDHYNS